VKTARNQRGWRFVGTSAWALGLAATCAWGGIAAPLYVGNLVPVKDEFGRILAGSHLPAGAATRSRVEIRLAPNGLILPPLADGTAHPANPLLSTNSVGGMGMNAAEANSGLFCMVFPLRPATGTKIFARVYNAPTAAEATFYADSAVGIASANGTSLVLAFGPAQPLDAGDADADGLNNSWEKALGIDDRATGDYDGDGMSDLDEMLAGTGADDAGSLLAFRSICPEKAPISKNVGAEGDEPQPVRVKWQSVPGRSYQLQFTACLTGAQDFIDVGEIATAAAGEYELERRVEVPEDAVAGTFRIQLVGP
jgi:hypothetical protein